MKKILFLFLFTISTTAQIKGVVKDSITKEPIAYVALVYENTEIGTNANSNGEFELTNIETNNKIIVSCLGYKSKFFLLSNKNEIYLSKKEELIEEIVIKNRKNRSEIIIDNYKNSQMAFGCNKAGNVWAKYIKFTKEVQNHPFIKKIQFTAKSRVKNAKVKLRFFFTNQNKEVVSDIIFDEIIVPIIKGTHKNIVDLEKYSIIIPKEGIFIGFENLIIEDNKHEYTYTIQGETGEHKGINYEPFIKGYEAKENNVWSIRNNNKFLFNSKFKKDAKPIELGIKLTLTN